MLKKSKFYHINRKRQVGVVYDSLLFFYKDKLYLTYNVMIKGPVLFLQLHCYNAILVLAIIQT